MTEEERWIADAKMGDHDAFRQLWEAHHAVVVAVALRLCQHRALAEEITQGAFVLAWQRLAASSRDVPFVPDCSRWPIAMPLMSWNSSSTICA